MATAQNDYNWSNRLINLRRIIKLIAILFVAGESISTWSYGSFRQNESQLTFGPFAEVEPMCSPDGKWVLFQYFHADQPGKPQLWLVPTLGNFSQARPLVDNGFYNAEASWSPDSQWVSYESITNRGNGPDIQLFKINIYTKDIFQLTSLSQKSGLAPGDSTSWSVKGDISFAMNGDIYAIHESGGGVKKLADVNSRYSFMEPSLIRWSPDATRLCFLARNPSLKEDQPLIGLVNLQTEEMRILGRGDFPSWLDNDHLLIVRRVSSRESRIGILSVRDRTWKTLTRGHVDITPAMSPSKAYLFFARESSSPSRGNNLNVFEGFHVWRVGLSQVPR
jgi:Tol biopolymer transport system component